jgi:hypothetical protein
MTEPQIRAELDGVYARITALETAAGGALERQASVKATLDKLETKIDAQTDIMHAMALTLAGTKAGFRVALWITSAGAAVGGFFINHFFTK